MRYLPTDLHKACYTGINWRFNKIIWNYNNPQKLRDNANSNASNFLKDINISNSSGQTPIYMAIYKNHQDIVRFLIANNADLNVKDKNGYTPFEFAIREHRNSSVLIFSQIPNLISIDLIRFAQRYNNIEAVSIMMINCDLATRKEVIADCKQAREIKRQQERARESQKSG